LKTGYTYGISMCAAEFDYGNGLIRVVSVVLGQVRRQSFGGATDSA
jgi:hypothetical protein